MDVDWARLAVAVAAADGLVELLVRVGQPDERDAGAALPVHPESGDAWLRDEDADGAVGEPEHRARLVLFGVRPGDLDGAGDGARERFGFGVEVAPHDPLLVGLFGDDRGDLADALVDRVSPGAAPLDHRLRGDGEQRLAGVLVYIDDVVVYLERVEVVPVVALVRVEVRRLAERDGPRRDEVPERAGRVPLEPPRRRRVAVLGEVERERFAARDRADELSVVEQLVDVVRGGRRGRG